ncbi:MAG: hypothetical protein H0V10_06785 [Geodermatophilaceae bacterium]|nr:hypothetical protein [Geodermatophilaceae bacterium]
MRWDRLFDDLEAQAVAVESREFEAEVAERSRAEQGRLRLTDRLRAARGHRVVLTVQGAGTVAGTLARVGAGWLLLAAPAEPELLVSLGAVGAVGGLGAATEHDVDRGLVEAALDLRKALRGLAVDRSGVRVTLTDGTAFEGTLDRVGADYVELAEHSLGEARRQGAVRSVRTIVIGSVALVARTER